MCLIHAHSRLVSCLSRIDILNLVTPLHSTPRFEWYAVWCDFESGTKKNDVFKRDWIVVSEIR